MFYTRKDDKKPRVWSAPPEQFTLKQALETLNPDSLYQPIAKRRGAYERILIELNKGGHNEKN